METIINMFASFVGFCGGVILITETVNKVFKVEGTTAAATTGCVTSFVVVLLKKPGVFFRHGEDIGPSFAEWCQAGAPKLIGELMSCDYCMSWWLSWLVSIPAAVLTGDILWLLVPFCSTSVGRLLSA